jgi:hypothetical protein
VTWRQLHDAFCGKTFVKGSTRRKVLSVTFDGVIITEGRSGKPYHWVGWNGERINADDWLRWVADANEL